MVLDNLIMKHYLNIGRGIMNFVLGWPITERDIFPYFYSRLLPSVRDSIDATSGGALIDKTPLKQGS